VSPAAVGRLFRCHSNREYGKGNWRKLKGVARVRLADGTIAEAEIPWFEAHGIGKRRMKVKQLIE
jgi:hypothetical protein